MAKKSEAKLKELKSQAQRKLGTIEVLRQDFHNFEKRLRDEERSLTAIYHQISEIEGDGHLSVSDHALVRYLERVEKQNIQELKARILTPGIIAQHAQLGSGIFPNNDSFSVLIQNNVVITIITPDSKRKVIHPKPFKDHESDRRESNNHLSDDAHQ